ncbi:MAG: CAP domain-containing protein [Burkholderiales bacterium]|nr:MAG: CAP domain-containing protein [Burkholderiales bacterium]RPH68055.1 MAG: CAP domain-containing protein [Burkholderiales bacterium]
MSSTRTHRHRRRSRADRGNIAIASRLMRVAAGAALASLIGACGGGDTGSTATAAAVAGASTNADPAVAATTPSTTSAVDVAATLQHLNAARAVPRDCGGTGTLPAVPPLRWNAELEQAAVGHSEWMQANDTFSHTGADGSSVGTRATAAGYAWRSVGENIAAGQRDVAAVIAAWLASPGHCRNIMHPDFVDSGLALKPGTSSNTYRTWWTLVLGRPR